MWFVLLPIWLLGLLFILGCFFIANSGGFFPWSLPPPVPFPLLAQRA